MALSISVDVTQREGTAERSGR